MRCGGQVVKKDTLQLKDMISVRTNLIDWAALMPNIGVEVDLINRSYSKWTIAAEGVYKWNDSKTIIPSRVYNNRNATLEVRHYYRTSVDPSSPRRDYEAGNARDSYKPFTYRTHIAVVENDKGQKDTIEVTDTIFSFVKFTRNLFTTRRSNPRTWRSYYFGGYITGGSFSYMFSRYGHQGKFYSAGATFGYSIPMYTYKNHFLDMEFGGRAGFALSNSVQYQYDDEGRCYSVMPRQSKDMHFVPYPVLTDLHCSVVYRFLSVKNKYKNRNEVRYERRKEKYKRTAERNDSLMQDHYLKVLERRKIQEDREILINHYRDSVLQIRKERLEQKQKERENSKVLLKENRKNQKRLSKQTDIERKQETDETTIESND